MQNCADICSLEALKSRRFLEYSIRIPCPGGTSSATPRETPGKVHYPRSTNAKLLLCFSGVFRPGLEILQSLHGYR